MVHSGLTDAPAGLTENEQNSGKVEKNKQSGNQGHGGTEGKESMERI